MKTAVEQNLNPFNPCTKIRRPRPPKQEIRALNDKQAGNYLKSIAKERNDLESLFVLALGTGARQA